MLKYVGNGSSLLNVPARDLTEVDLEALKMTFDINKQELLASGLYLETGKAQGSKTKQAIEEDKEK